MFRTWRWFGSTDKVTLSDARQAGAEGIVTALHHIEPGEVWTTDEIARRQSEISKCGLGLEWQVAESLPVSEAIKTKGREFSAHIQTYKHSLTALADAGIQTICYNFMPVLDWTRTDLRWALDNGARALRFDLVSFAVFDCFILVRPGAEDDYSEETLELAGEVAHGLNEAQRFELSKAVTAGLPGAAELWSMDGLKAAISAYSEIDEESLRQNHIDFLSEVVALAEALGIRLCCHPDDPPFPLLGLPRIMSSEEGYAKVLDEIDSPAVGMTLCTGSLGASPKNDCVKIAERFAEKLFFLHLRNVTRDTETLPCSFFEDEHLNGQVDLARVIDVVLKEEKRRRKEGRSDTEIPMRPDHGQDILTDLDSDFQPGYPAVGRLKGLAEINGIVAGLERGYAT